VFHAFVRSYLLDDAIRVLLKTPRSQTMQMRDKPVPVLRSLVASETEAVSHFAILVVGSDELINLLLRGPLDAWKRTSKYVAAIPARALPKRPNICAEHSLVPHE